jgi:hypothetical protein
MVWYVAEGVMVSVSSASTPSGRLATAAAHNCDENRQNHWEYMASLLVRQAICKPVAFVLGTSPFFSAALIFKTHLAHRPASNFTHRPLSSGHADNGL